MRRIIFAAVTGSFAALVAPSALQAQEEAPPRVGIARYAVSRGGNSGGTAVRPSLIAQKHSGALLSGGKPGNPGHNQLTARQRAQAVRGQLIGRSEHSSRRVAAGRPSLIPQPKNPTPHQARAKE